MKKFVLSVITSVILLSFGNLYLMPVAQTFAASDSQTESQDLETTTSTETKQEIPWAWYTSRVMGITTLVLMGVIVNSGLFMTTDLFQDFIKQSKISKGTIFTFHDYLSLFALISLCIHFLVLIFDKYMHPSIIDLLIPFREISNTNLVAIGIIAFYIFLAVFITSKLVRYIPFKMWRFVHSLTFIAFTFGMIHGFLIGTDTKIFWVQSIYYILGGSVLIILSYRVYRLVTRKVNI